MTTPQDPHRPGAGGQPPTPDPWGQQAQPGQYPTQPGQYPGQPAPYPGQPGQDPAQSGRYGAQPGQYPGAPGQFPPPPGGPGQFPPPPGAPGAGGPAKSALPRVLIAVLLVLVIGLGVFLFIQNKQNDPTAAAVGECLEIEGTTTAGNPKSERIDCADPAAQFTVTETGSTVSCDRLELSYVQYRGDDESEVTGTVCLRPNFEVGECYIEPQDKVTLPKLGDCASVDGDVKVKVESVNANTADTSVCSTPQLSYTYTKRNEVVCFAEAS